MPRYKRYRLDKLDVSLADERPATWDFAREPVSGTQYLYTVRDGNFPARNAWDFAVKVPKAPNGRIEVRPANTPPGKAWAGLQRRSLTFTRATKGSYKGWHYCQIALADPTGERTKHVTRKDERHDLPPWFQDLGNRIREKSTVRATKGHDGNQLVCTVRPDDHATMIGLFFATKVWVLKESVVLD